MSESIGDKIASSENLRTKAPSQIAYEIDEAVATATALAYEMAAQIAEAERHASGWTGLPEGKWWTSHEKIAEKLRAAIPNHDALIAAWRAKSDAASRWNEMKTIIVALMSEDRTREEVDAFIKQRSLELKASCNGGKSLNELEYERGVSDGIESVARSRTHNE